MSNFSRFRLIQAWLRSLRPSGAPPPHRRDRAAILRHWLLVTVLVYATLLRFEALVAKWGPIEGSRRAEAFQVELAGAIAYARPDDLGWQPERFLSGDPFDDVRHAREMYSFYAPSVREPIFIFTTKLFQWLVGYQPIVVCLASGRFSALGVWATYLLGSYAFSPWVGLGAALGLAVEQDVISQGVIGFKDDTFTVFFLLLAFAVMRAWDQPTFRWVLLSDLVAGAACLTRITSLTFALPALAFVGLSVSPAAWRTRLKAVGFAASMMAVAVVPFLLACWIAFGDPLFSITDRTRWYRENLGLPALAPMNPLVFL